MEVRGGREETPQVRGQGQLREATLRQRPGVVTLRSHLKPKARAAAGRNYPHRRPGLAAGRSNPGAVAAQAQKGLEELAHVEGQEWQR